MTRNWRSLWRAIAAAAVSAAIGVALPSAQRAVPTLASAFGWEPCADYKLATYEQIEGYFRAVAAAAPARVRLVDMGRTTEGRTQVLAIVSSEENIRRLDRLKGMQPSSAEYTVTRTYLEWLVELPWSISTEDHIELPEVRRCLDEDHYDLDKVKKRIVE